MTRGYASRDGENEAFIVDRYLDSLLARRTGRRDRPPGGAAHDGGGAGGRAAALSPVVPIRGSAGRAAGRHGGAGPQRCGRRQRAHPVPARPGHDRAGRSPDRHPAGRHRRGADVGGHLARRCGLRRLAPQPPARRSDGPRRSAPPPGEGPPDAAQAAVVPCPPGCVSAGPVDQVPDLLDDAVQQAAREEPAGVHDVRPPLPAVGERATRPPPRSGLLVGARSGPAVGRRPRLRGPETVPGPAERGPGRDGHARRRRLGDGSDRRHAARCLRHGLRVHGRLDGRGRRREGDAGGRARPGGPRAAAHRQRLGRGADAGGDAGADAAGQDARGARAAARGRRAVRLDPVRPDDGRRLRLVRGRG